MQHDKGIGERLLIPPNALHAGNPVAMNRATVSLALIDTNAIRSKIEKGDQSIFIAVNAEREGQVKLGAWFACAKPKGAYGKRGAKKDIRTIQTEELRFAKSAFPKNLLMARVSRVKNHTPYVIENVTLNKERLTRNVFGPKIKSAFLPKTGRITGPIEKHYWRRTPSGTAIILNTASKKMAIGTPLVRALLVRIQTQNGKRS